MLPEPIKDFIFDLHQATRKTRKLEDVQKLYDIKFKELSEKYFAQTPWPSPKHVESDCYYDEDFLLFYREMTLRHLFSKQKPVLADHLQVTNKGNALTLYSYDCSVCVRACMHSLLTHHMSVR